MRWRLPGFPSYCRAGNKANNKVALNLVVCNVYMYVYIYYVYIYVTVQLQSISFRNAI